MRRFLIILCIFAVTVVGRVSPGTTEEPPDGMPSVVQKPTSAPITQAGVSVGIGTEKPQESSAPATVTTAPPEVEIPPKNPREDVLVCLDAGHGLIDPGAIGWLNGTEYYEKTLNLAVALRAKQALEARGYRVLMIRTGDTSLLGGSDRGASYKTADEAVARRQLAKRMGADLYISVHCNAYVGATRAYGPLVFYNSSPATTYRALSLARAFSTRFTEMNAGYAGAKACEVREGNSYIVLRELTMPALLLELGFMTDEGDLSLLIRKDWQEDCAAAIASGVEDAFLNGWI